jgi:hypothetical protein
MIATMEEVAPDRPPITPSVKSDAVFSTRGLEQFCTTNSKKLSQVLGMQGLSEIMLSRDPAPWEEDEAFREAQEVLKGLAVINDRAGRGVALIQDLNKKLTKDEDQLQFPLPVVSEHRQQCLLSDGQKLI